jgi:bisanhydrobacterioruberin hydratase
MSTTLSNPWRIYGRAVVFVLAVLFTVGAAGHAHPATLPWMLTLTPWFSLLTGVLVIVPPVIGCGRRFILWVAVTYALTFLAEAVGVATGLVFGDYVYGPTLGWSWLGVPVIIAFNWAMVVHGSFCIARKAVASLAEPRRRWATVLLTGGLAAGFDFLMEPVAIQLDYWTWAGETIPLQNYAAWFAIAAAAAAIHPRETCADGGRCSTGRLASAYVVMQALFFVALRLIWHFGGG